MHESVAGCLLFANDGSQTVERLTCLLRERGIYVAQAAERDECLALLDARRWRWLVIDADGTRSNGLGVLSQSRRVRPEVPALVLVRRGDTQTAVQAIKAGAADCLETPIATGPLFAVLNALGGPGGAASHYPPVVNLTRMERLVLGHILDNCTNRQIAELLKRSPRTIEVHRRHAMEKLKAANLVELVKQAMRAGMLNGRRWETESIGPRDKSVQAPRA
jgi:FixJ family two-component response regulator